MEDLQLKTDIMTKVYLDLLDYFEDNYDTGLHYITFLLNFEVKLQIKDLI